MITAVVLLAAASPAAPAPRIEPLIDRSKPRTKPEDAPPPELACTADQRWCFELSRDVDLNSFALHVFDGRKPRTEDGKVKDAWTYELSDAPQNLGFDREGLRMWPQIIREAATDAPREGDERGETISIGLLASRFTMYSGGGAHADRLSLFRFEHSGYGQPLKQDVLSVPYTGSIMIRACFSEEDFDKRGGACHDLYDFDATLMLDPRKRAEPDIPPRLIYQTEATATPGISRRMNDNSSGRKLSAADIRPAIDSTCTYRRILAYNPATERYEFDRPAPDCSDYTVP